MSTLVTRIWGCKDLRRLRAEYLWPLAHLASCPPAAADQLTVGDFANLVTGIDALIAARR